MHIEEEEASSKELLGGCVANGQWQGIQWPHSVHSVNRIRPMGFGEWLHLN